MRDDPQGNFRNDPKHSFAPYKNAGQIKTLTVFMAPPTRAENIPIG